VKGDESVVSIQGGIDERRGPSAWYIFALPKPGEEPIAIRNQIFEEISSLHASGPSPEEMEKLRNSLRNDVVRGRQSTMYRAQRLAEYALYDGDPTLFDSELDQYLAITPEQIRNAVGKYLDVDNRVVLDIVPAATEEVADGAAASPQPPGESTQPTSPSPQVPLPPPTEPSDADSAVKTGRGKLEPPQQPADPPKQTETGSGPLHT
jgi:hypothetical protein